MRFLIWGTVFGVLNAVFVQKLVWREAPKSKAIREGRFDEHKRSRHLNNDLALRQRRGGIYSQKLLDYQDTEYLANVKIGGSNQEFLVLMDTGSADFWVPSTACKKNPCPKKHRFDPSKSTSFKTMPGTWVVPYGTGSASGTYGNDTIKFDGLTIPGVEFGVANQLATDFGSSHFDGIMGLAFQSLAKNNVTPVVLSAIAQGLLAAPVFTIYYQRRGDHDGVPGGQITFGGVDTKNCGQSITYLPLTQARHFQFKVDAVKAGGFIHNQPFEVISDSGTAAIVGTTESIGWLVDAIGARVDEDGYFFANCNTKTTLDFTIGGKVFSIQPENYIFPGRGKRCQVAFATLDSIAQGNLTYILGDPFIRQFCNIYDLGGQRIGFATANQRK